MAKSQLHDLARLGARSRLDALDREREEILGIFPELRSRTSASPAKAQARRTPASRRSGMSAEAREAQSARMTAYWAARRAAKAAAAGENGGSQSGEARGSRGSRRGRNGRRKK